MSVRGSAEDRVKPAEFASKSEIEKNNTELPDLDNKILNKTEIDPNMENTESG